MVTTHLLDEQVRKTIARINPKALVGVGEYSEEVATLNVGQFRDLSDAIRRASQNGLVYVEANNAGDVVAMYPLGALCRRIRLNIGATVQHCTVDYSNHDDEGVRAFWDQIAKEDFDGIRPSCQTWSRIWKPRPRT